VYGALVIRNMLKHFRGYYKIKGVVTERQLRCVSGRCQCPGAGGHLAFGRHSVAYLPYPAQLINIVVERHHPPAPPEHLERVPPRPAPQIQRPVPGSDRKPGEIHGKHGSPPSPWFPLAAIAARYWSAVARATAGQA
jgi:hypothetical protein